MVYKLTKVYKNGTWHQCAQKFFPLHTKTQNYHLKYPNAKCHNLKEKLNLNELLMLTNRIILAISGRDNVSHLV